METTAVFLFFMSIKTGRNVVMEEGDDQESVSKSFSKSSTFSVAVTGQIEKVSCPSFNHVYCKYTCHYGTDWTVAAGNEEGITQIAKKSVFPALSSISHQQTQ